MTKNIIATLLLLTSFSFSQSYANYEKDLTKLSVDYKSLASQEFYKSLQEEIIRSQDAQKIRVDYWTLPPMKHIYYCGDAPIDSGEGTKSKPWNVFDTLEGKHEILPNSTIFIEGGTYKRRPKERIDLAISGAKNEPIIIRPKIGEEVTIDGGIAIDFEEKSDPEIDSIWLCGLTITISEPMHLDGSNDVTRPLGGIWFSGGKNCKLINNRVYNCTSSGISIWSAAKEVEVYGNIVYDNGNVRSDRAHGHALYAQNKAPSRKIFTHNILSAGPEGFTKTLALQCYGSSNSFVENCYVRGNLLLGRVILGRTGSEGSDKILYDRNYQDKGGLDFGYLATRNGVGIYRNNVMTGGSVNVIDWDLLIANRNKIIANNPSRYLGGVHSSHTIVKFPSEKDEFKFWKNKYLKNQYILITLDLNGDGVVRADFSEIGVESIEVCPYNSGEPVYSGKIKIVGLKNFVSKDPENGINAIINGFIVKTNL